MEQYQAQHYYIGSIVDMHMKQRWNLSVVLYINIDFVIHYSVFT